MTTARAFKRYAEHVLKPMIAALCDHLIEPVAQLIADYLTATMRTKEELFARAIGSSLITYIHRVNNQYGFGVSLVPSPGPGVIGIINIEDIDGCMTWDTRKIVDPPVQNLHNAVRMFDIPIALLSRISVASSWSFRCLCDGDGTCIRCANRRILDLSGKEIVNGIWKSYDQHVDNLIGLYLHHYW